MTSEQSSLERNWIKCGSPLGEWELHCTQQQKQQIEKALDLQQLTNRGHLIVNNKQEWNQILQKLQKLKQIDEYLKSLPNDNKFKIELMLLITNEKK